MASGIIHDLNIDDNFLTCDPWTERIRSDELDKIRVYVSYIYLVSTYATKPTRRFKANMSLPMIDILWCGKATDI